MGSLFNVFCSMNSINLWITKACHCFNFLDPTNYLLLNFTNPSRRKSFSSVKTGERSSSQETLVNVTNCQLRTLNVSSGYFIQLPVVNIRFLHSSIFFNFCIFYSFKLLYIVLEFFLKQLQKFVTVIIPIVL